MANINTFSNAACLWNADCIKESTKVHKHIPYQIALDWIGWIGLCVEKWHKLCLPQCTDMHNDEQISSSAQAQPG